MTDSKDYKKENKDENNSDYKKDYKNDNRNKDNVVESFEEPKQPEVDFSAAKVDKAHAVGRRKEAIARVRLVPGKGAWIINGKTIEEYLPNKVHQQLAKSPLVLVKQEGNYDVFVNVKGGGVSGQAGAIRLGVARALNEADRELLRPTLKTAGFLKRDARAVERKKPGLKKARKASQFSKR